MALLFFASAVIINLNTLSDIVEVNEIFFINPLIEKRYISYRKTKNAGEEEIKTKLDFNCPIFTGSCER